MNSLNEKSLLWVRGFEHKNKVFDENSIQEVVNDFNVGILSKLMSNEPHYNITASDLLECVTYSYDDIIYRNQLLRELEQNKEAEGILEKLLSSFSRMKYMHNNTFEDFPIKKILLRYEKLSVYASIMDGLKNLFATSSNTHSFYQFITNKYEIEKIDDLKINLLAIGKIISKFKSLKIGANINPQFKVNEGTILSVNRYQFEEKYLLDKLLIDEDKSYKRTSIALISNIKNANETPEFTFTLYRELQRLLSPELRKINNIMEQHKETITSRILVYYKEIKFYYGAIRYVKQLRNNGETFCYGALSNDNLSVTGLYSLTMADESKTIKSVVVAKNDFEMNSNQIALITGPNSGGKTVFVQAFVAMQILFQSGLPVPAKKASLKIYKRIFSHFPKDEDLTKGSGRLGEEIVRMASIAKKATKDSLIIMNEPFVTTNPSEGVKILELIINKIISLQTQSIIVTHYLDIYDQFSNHELIRSYYLEIKDEVRTYKIKEGSPLSESYARSIARMYGLTYDDIMKGYNKRRNCL